ncbi:AraC family transcriptional regulator [Ekhidna sp.]|jgi:AraC-like DNA-binding protein|uniref:AraC family transcriptional regulator n=1 Tax=Ekhidna sp. TaxID=2608089 RepID=UPI003B59B3E9
MTPETLYIKNMVCNRCIQVVREELNRLGIEVVDIQLGEVKLSQKVNLLQLDQIREVIMDRGFELLEDSNSKIIEQIKTSIIDLIHNPEVVSNQNVSHYLEKKIGKDYSYLSNLFSSVENITIERYLILQKVEKVKELLVYDEMTLSEISYKLNYSSVQYLSGQFRKVTGMSPSEFKKLTTKERLPLDGVTTQ